MLALSGTQQAPQCGNLLLRIRNEQFVGGQWAHSVASVFSLVLGGMYTYFSGSLRFRFLSDPPLQSQQPEKSGRDKQNLLLGSSKLKSHGRSQSPLCAR